MMASCNCGYIYGGRSIRLAKIHCQHLGRWDLFICQHAEPDPALGPKWLSACTEPASNEKLLCKEHA
jgi:hypothetical protein